MIDRVVMYERGEMHEFDDGRERQRVVVITLRDPTRQQEQGRPKELPAHEEEMLVHLLDVIEVRHDDAPDLVTYTVQ